MSTQMPRWIVYRRPDKTRADILPAGRPGDVLTDLPFELAEVIVEAANGWHARQSAPHMQRLGDSLEQFGRHVKQLGQMLEGTAEVPAPASPYQHLPPGWEPVAESDTPAVRFLDAEGIERNSVVFLKTNEKRPAIKRFDKLAIGMLFVPVPVLHAMLGLDGEWEERRNAPVSGLEAPPDYFNRESRAKSPFSIGGQRSPVDTGLPPLPPGWYWQRSAVEPTARWRRMTVALKGSDDFVVLIELDPTSAPMKSAVPALVVDIVLEVAGYEPHSPRPVSG